MYETYKKLYGYFLSICKDSYDAENPAKTLKTCIENCNSYSDMLLGMLILMEHAGVISSQIMYEEQARVLNEFFSVNVCNAYMMDGKVYIFKGKRG